MRVAVGRCPTVVGTLLVAACTTADVRVCDHADAGVCEADPTCQAIFGRVVDEARGICAPSEIFVDCLPFDAPDVWCPDADTTAVIPGTTTCIAFAADCHDESWDACPRVSDLFSCDQGDE